MGVKFPFAPFMFWSSFHLSLVNQLLFIFCIVAFSLFCFVFFSCLKSNIAEEKIYTKQEQWFFLLIFLMQLKNDTHKIYLHHCKFSLGIEFAVETLKSFILTMALIDNHLSVEKAVALSRLEVEFQVCETRCETKYNHVNSLQND